MKLWAGIVLVFLLGALAGSLATGIYFKHGIERFAKGERPPIKVVLMKKLSHELDLTETQRVGIEQILDQLQAKLLDLRRKHRPEFERLFNHSFGSVREKLNSDQKKRLDEIREELRSRRPFRTKKTQ
ncbi:MAG: hypothetical protein GTN74_03855 [Proteobacteria bacterium]|nr:hypothetical protein [Pseudomonadota bacterium]NIS68418.1 hypothetical protein [Pseudomonadota bacterium]